MSNDNTINPAEHPYAGVIHEISASRVENLDERGIPKNLGPQFRAMERAGYDENDHTVSMALSSDKPVERWYGTEILSHKPGAIREGRLKQGIPLLFNHDMNLHLGVSTGYEISGGTLRTTSRFGGNPLAQEKEGDVRSGILKDNSVGYMVYEWEITEDKNGVRTMTAVDWEPFEGSLVTVPADAKGSGVGRNTGEGEIPVKYSFRKLDENGDEIDPDEDDEDDDEDDEENRSSEADTSTDSARTTTPETQRTVTMPPEITEVVDTAAQEQARVAELRTLHTNYPAEFNERSLTAAIGLGMTTSIAKTRIAEAIMTAAQRDNVPTAADEVFEGMSARELERYSIAGAYRAAVNDHKAGTFRGKEEGGFEREVGETLRKTAGERGISGLGTGIIIPSATTRALARSMAQRAITSGGGVGTATNFTTVEADPIQMLRNRTVCLAMGARMLTGLHGQIQIPRQNSAAQSSWLAESAAATESDPGMDYITIKPNRLSMWNAYTLDFLAQSSLAVDAWLAADRMNVLVRSLDTAGLAGSGTAPVPKGLLNQSGLAAIISGTTRAANGTVTAGAGGVPMTFVDWNNLEAAISTANGDIGTIGIVTTPKLRAAGRSTPQIPGTASGFVFPNSKVGPDGVQEGPLGYNTACTSNSALTGFTYNSVPNLHGAIMGVWDQMFYGDWGLSEVIVDPYTGGKAAIYNIYEHAFYDVNFQHIESFAACTTALPS